jgi:hypothetical protein
MAAIISDRSDAALAALLASQYPGASFTTFLTAVKTRLDNTPEIQPFRVSNGGEYSWPLVKQGVTRVRGV